MFNLTINEDEFKKLIREAVREEVAAQINEIIGNNNKNIFEDGENRWVYGYKGIMSAFKWGRNKVADFLKDSFYEEAIVREGDKKIALNVPKARELMQKKEQERKNPKRRRC